jgi:hypothetical protein
MRVAGSQIPIYPGVAGEFVQSSNKDGDGIAETALETPGPAFGIDPTTF